ncbi:MAG: hypothetical protein GX316_10815 [Firmicutes bacterium]|nr:hypothetical protein [Bacillota bacterium]
MIRSRKFSLGLLILTISVLLLSFGASATSEFATATFYLVPPQAISTLSLPTL